ncbi:MAG: Lrp/AsnC family transcriptional regulator [Microlunatus sp.]|nr:Lrp/AsnC family transcriptional regulator [Microlunatus sp.]MDN5771047.1 Lrp/AsnC family transcriptional regulator [Microlunatus sp.]MDN5803557.1 Lrp/AsnC family transcriptional regulator [Microlunatus sp.]
MDVVDERILQQLVRNARATFAEIGAHVNLSPPAVKRRVDRMVADGTIAGFTTIVDPESLGWGTEAYVQVFCKGTVSPQALLALWESIPEVVSASTVTGQADAIVRVRARDVRHLEEAMEQIRGEETIDHTESIIVLSRLIERG